MPADTFEYLGQWWEPAHPKRKWSGTLRFDNDDGAKLTLIIPFDKPVLFPVSKEYELIHGQTTTGEHVTLCHCFDLRTPGSLNGPRALEIRANSIIVGLNSKVVDPLVSVATASFRHLNAWWGQSGIQADHSKQWPRVALSYEPRSAVVVHQGSDFTIKIESFLTGSFEVQSVSLVDGVQFEIRASNPTPLSEFRRVAHACRDLLAVACLSLSFERLKFLAVNAPRRPATFYGVPVHKEATGDQTTPDFLFQFRDIEQTPTAVFDSWLSYAERLEPVRALYLAGIHTPTFVEIRFLSLIQAAEAFHRRLYYGNTLAKQPHVKARRPSHDSLSLEKRLEILITKHQEAMDSVVPNPLSFLPRLLDYRHNFTHQPLQSPAGPRIGEEIMRHNFVLRTLLELCFLEAMGFTEDDITKFAKRCTKYKQISERFFKP